MVLALGRQMRVDLSEFVDSRVNRSSSRAAMAFTKRKPSQKTDPPPKKKVKVNNNNKNKTQSYKFMS